MLVFKEKISTYKHIFLVFAVLFTLTPCAVKTNLYTFFEADHHSGLNKSKVTVSRVGNCGQSLVAPKVQQSTALKIWFKPVGLFRSYLADFFSITPVYTLVLPKRDSLSAIGQQCPRYILFKRWKLDLA